MIRKVSEKRLRANGGKPMFSTIAKKSHIEKRPRSKSEFARIYHSKARVLFVKSLPCVGCGRTGFIDNAHIENGGAGRKADYDKIIPLCTFTAPKFSCHGRLHQHGRFDLEWWGGINLDTEAQKTEQSWQSHIAALIKEK